MEAINAFEYSDTSLDAFKDHHLSALQKLD